MPVRAALTGVVSQWGRSMDAKAGLSAETTGGSVSNFQPLQAAEEQYGSGMGTTYLLEEAGAALRQMPTADRQHPGADSADERDADADKYRVAVLALRRLLARVGDQSNLILDPDLDSYYTMSVVVIDTAEVIDALAELSVAAQTLTVDGDQSAEAHAKFLVTEGRALAAVNKMERDVDTAYRVNADGSLQRRLDHIQRAASTAIGALITELKLSALLNRNDKPTLEHVSQLRQQALDRTDALWREAGSSLDGLLRQRIAMLYRHMATNLGTAAAISLAALLLILHVARQISRPIRELAGVAESVQLTRNYQLRAKVPGDGEIGILVRGFNEMLDRLQAESAGEQERSARESAAATQREMLETMPVWLAVMRNADRSILYSNHLPAVFNAPIDPSAERSSLIDRLETSDRTKLFQRLAEQGEVDHMEALLRVSPTQHVWVLVFARPLSYQEQECSLIVFTPINDLKLAEQEREKSARRLVDAVESLGEGFALFDGEDRLVLWNQRYRDIGKTTKDMLKHGTTWLDLVTTGLERGEYPEAEGQAQSWLAQRIEHRRNPGRPLEILLKSGQWLQAVDRRTREGGLVSILADITRQKSNEHELSVSEAFKSAIINSALDSIISIDEEGAVLEFNPAAERSFGWRRDQVMGRQMIDLIVPDHLRHDHETGFGRYLETGTRHVIGRRFETEARDANGRIFPVELAIGDVALEGRRAFTAWLRDITERRSAEAELARRASMLEAIGVTAAKIVTGVNWREEMHGLLGRLGAAAEVSRVTLFENHEGPDGRLVQSCRFDWAKPGLATISNDPRYQNMSLSDDDSAVLNDWSLRRQRGEVVQATRSETNGYARQVFDEHGTLSFLSVPVMLGTKWWGFLGFDDSRTERAWSDVEVDVLKTAAALISGAIERANAEERLRLSEQRYALAARGANDGLLDWDITQDSAYFSPRLHEILGLVDGTLGKAPRELFKRVVREDAIDLWRGLQDRIAWQHRKFEFECRMLHATGGERWMLWRGIIVYRGEIAIRVVGSIHDIDKRKIAEALLRESEARFRALSDDAPVLLNLVDRQGKVTFANRRFLLFTGRTLDEVLGDGWMRDVHPDDLAPVQQWAGQAVDDPNGTARNVAGRNGVEFEYRLRRRDGEYRWVHETQVARSELDGSFAGFVASLVDVTDRRRAEAEVVRQREALYQSEKLTALGSLLAGVAHELNNPLSVVVGQATLLEEIAQEKGIVARSQTIRRAAERCARIVRTFLTLARQRRPEQGLVQLNTVIGMAIELLGYQLRILDAEVRLSLAPDLPELMADGDQLHQVITNLIVNALQALADAPPPRRLTIATSFNVAQQSVRLTVADTGPGIKPEIRSRIFEPFFTTKPIGQGTGIGLAICLNVVSAHKGTITVEETPGGGATFVVELPLAAAGDMRVAQAASARRADLPTGRYRILVVDDEVEIADTLKEILTGAGHDVEIAGNGRSALDRLAVSNYQVLLSDLRMPVLDGPGLYAALEEEYPAMVSRIAFITGDTLSVRNGEFLARTGAMCLEKPFTPDDVRQFVARLVTGAS
ncbi:MAG: PAS domain S-box protein [Dongiaceae bacterium]